MTTERRTICGHCGDDGDVVERVEYVGGRAYEMRAQCRDIEACWARHDAALAAGRPAPKLTWPVRR